MMKKEIKYVHYVKSHVKCMKKKEERRKSLTKCIDPLFLENNNCVLNCSEGLAPDPILRYCYEVNYINQTRNIDKIVYANISVPEPYPFFIQKNICLKYNETI